MVAILAHTPPPVVDNFYQNSFKQLSMVQQRQVGLLIGVAVADAAARPLDGYTPEEVEAYLQHMQEKLHGAGGAAAASTKEKATSTAEDLLVFARVAPRGLEEVTNTNISAAVRLPAAVPRGTHPLSRHSFTYQLYFEVLRAMSRARGEFAVDFVQEQLVGVASDAAVQQAFAQEHASLLHTLCCLLPTPAIYPYASDAALRQYLDPFVDFLTESPTGQSGKHERAGSTTAHDHNTRDRDTDAVASAEAAAAERAAVRDFTFSALGVVLRNLQSNPDSTRNAAFMAVPGAATIFPSDVQAFVPMLSDDGAAAAAAGTEAAQARRHLWEVQQKIGAAAAAATAAANVSHASHRIPRWLPQRCTARDAAVVCESLTIARGPVTFAKGVAQAIRLGGPTCQRAMLVGALLGTKLGVRHVPLDWLSATPDHKPVATMALEVAQWSWNPLQHR